MTIYLSEVDPFILLQPYIWLKSTFFLFYGHIFLFYGHIFGGSQPFYFSTTIYLAEVLVVSYRQPVPTPSALLNAYTDGGLVVVIDGDDAIH